jgi:hypothetical protein
MWDVIARQPNIKKIGAGIWNRAGFQPTEIVGLSFNSKEITEAIEFQLLAYNRGCTLIHPTSVIFENW